MSGAAMNDAAERQYEELFRTFQLDETVLQADPAETLKLSLGDAATTMDALPTFHLGTDGGETPQASLQVGRTLGEGGMGVIRAAVQAPFGREVALKTVQPSRAGDAPVVHALLREAIVTGRLEHPNVVPIYAVGQDEQGHPVIVMKRIDGYSWREALDAGSDDPLDELERNLDIFQEVCAAVHFAHRHGVLHRDIKPDNVMLGSHEDVYLVDWGLAIALQPEQRGLPWVGDIKQLAGTPNYMAPEMASAGREPLGVWTDVYLLGAVLHELATGTPRHQGATMYALLLCAHASEPVTYGPEVPAELAAICNRATHRDPQQRFASALELRAAVAEFLAHRSAASLTEEAFAQLGSLRDVLETPAPQEEARVAVYRLYGAARFGFERSLAEWPGQPRAREGLQQTLAHIIEWELTHGSVHAAAAALADLPMPRPDLELRIREVEEERDAREQELESLREKQRQGDIGLGARSRALFAMLIILGGLLLPAALRALGLFNPMKSPEYFWALSLVVGVAVAVSVLLASRYEFGPFKLMRTETNRRIVFSLVLITLFLPVFRGLGLLAGLTMPMQLMMEMAVFTLFSAQLALAFDKRIAPAAAAYGVATLSALVLPDHHAFSIYLLGGSVAVGWIVWIWLPSRVAE